MSDQNSSIIAFKEVSWSGEAHLAEGLDGVSCSLQPGELALVQRDARIHGAALFDLAQGLRAPDRGTVEFGGHEWSSLSIFEAARQRGAIGRVFEAMGWISNLDVYENIALSQRHHTRRAESDIREEALQLSGAAGFPEMPACRPHLLRRDELARAQWVRAFMGRPALVLLESPELDVHRDDLARLAGMIATGQAGGTAAIWLSPTPTVWDDLKLQNVRRFDLQERRLNERTGA